MTSSTGRGNGGGGLPADRQLTQVGSRSHVGHRDVDVDGLQPLAGNGVVTRGNVDGSGERDGVFLLPAVAGQYVPDAEETDTVAPDLLLSALQVADLDRETALRLGRLKG